MVPLCDNDDREQRLVRFIRGSTRPVSAPELAAELRVDVRKAGAIVAHLRADHHMPIASTPAGSYWWPKSRDDWNRTKASMLSRVIEVQRAVDGGDQGADEMFGEEGTGQMALGLR